MTSRTYEFIQLDVFTRTLLTGNPLAIFTNAHGLSDNEMQALAREMNLAETTFVLPRDPNVETREGKRVRIFTIQEELPFAGHPTLGTALYLYRLGGAIDQIVLDLNVGKIPVQFTPDFKNAGIDRVDGKVFGQMRQRDPEFGAIVPRENIAETVGIDASEIPSQWPVQVVSTGLPFAIVPIASLQVLAKLNYDARKAAAALEATSARFCYFVCVESVGIRAEAQARMFFYGGEDPATGSAAGCAASWLVQHGLIKSDERALIRQGVEASRPSEIFVEASKTNDGVTNVRVGGYAVEVLRGTVIL